MTDPTVTQILLGITMPILVTSGIVFYRAVMKYKNRNFVALLKFRLAMIALFLVVIMMSIVTLLNLQHSSVPNIGYLGKIPLILLLAINAGTFGRFLYMPDSIFIERARVAETLEGIAGVIAHNEGVLRELERIQEARTRSTPFNPEATIKYTRTTEPLHVTPKRLEPEVYRPTRFERDEVI